MVLQWIQLMLQDNRQFQIEALLEQLLFGAGTQGYITAGPLTSAELRRLEQIIKHMWEYMHRYHQTIKLVVPAWALISLQFPGRNGALLFSQYGKVCEHLLAGLGIGCSDFAAGLMRLNAAETLEGFSFKCRMLGLDENSLLDNVHVEMVKEETITVTREDTLVPYMGDPIFEEEYMSQPGSLYNDLLSAFTMQEYQRFDDHISLHQEKYSAEVNRNQRESAVASEATRKKRIRSLQSVSEGECKLIVEGRHPSKKAKKHNRPTERRLKLKLLQHEQKQRVAADNEFLRAKLQKRKKPKQHEKPRPRLLARPLSDDMQEQYEQQPRRKKPKRRREELPQSEEEEPPQFLGEPLRDELKPLEKEDTQRPVVPVKPSKRRTEQYCVRKLCWVDNDLACGYSEPIRKLLGRVLCGKGLLTQSEQLVKLMAETAFLYFSRDGPKTDDLALVRCAHHIYLAAQQHSFEGLDYQLLGLLSAMMQSSFAKLVATITSVLTGASEAYLALPIGVMAEFSRMGEGDPTLRQALTIGECASRLFDDLRCEEAMSDNAEFFERPSLKQVYASCCDSIGSDSLDIPVVISARLAESLMWERGSFLYQLLPANRKKLALQYKRCVQQIGNRSSLLELWMQVDSLYPRGLTFEEWEVVYSFVEPDHEQRAVAQAELRFGQRSLQRFLGEQLTRTRNYKNVLNKILKQTFLAKVKTRPTRPLAELYFSAATILLRQELFRNEFVYREVLNGLEASKLIECGRSYQELLLGILFYSVQTNQNSAVSALESKQQLCLSSITDDISKSLLSWLGTLFGVIEDNLKHLSILKHPELLEKVSQQTGLLCQLLRRLYLAEDSKSPIPLELWVVRQRVLVEQPNLASLLHRSEEQYSSLAMVLIQAVCRHLAVSTAQVSLVSSPDAELVSEEEELILLNRSIKLIKVFQEASKPNGKGVGVLDYKAVFSKCSNSALLEQQLAISGTLFGYRIWCQRSSLEQLHRYIGQLLDRNLPLCYESLGRLAGHRLAAEIYHRALQLLAGHSLKLPFSEASLKLFYHSMLTLHLMAPHSCHALPNVFEELMIVAAEPRQPLPATAGNFWCRLTELARGKPPTPMVLLETAVKEAFANETELEELVRSLEKSLKALRESREQLHLLISASANLLALFSMILSSGRNLNKSVETLTQLFRCGDNEFHSGSLLVVLTQQSAASYPSLLEFLQRLEEYPSNIYKVKSISEQYLRWLARSYDQFVAVRYAGMSYEELLAHGPSQHHSDLEIFLQALVAYCRARPSAAALFRRLAAQLLQALWSIPKGLDQHREVLIIRVLTLAWIKAQIPELAPVVEEFAAGRLSDIAELLLSIPYGCQSPQWLLRGPLLAPTTLSDRALLAQCRAALDRLGVREDIVKLELE